MKFTYRELVLKSKKYKIYEPIEVSKQLRAMFTPKDYSCILANAEGFKLLYDLFLIMAGSKNDNVIIAIYDVSKDYEDFQSWYMGGEFHKNIVLTNFERTQISVKDFNRLLGMKKYVRSSNVQLQVPKVNFDRIVDWKLDNTLTVKNHGKWIMISSNMQGYMYMAREASYYLDMEDDPEETFSHSHLFFLSNLEDVLDMRYFYQEP